MLDAYCGTGTIGLIAAEHAKEVVGVELNPDAVKNAVSNARRNGRKNIRFVQGDAGEFMQRMAAERETVDVVLMDPPRAGSDEAFLSSLVTLAPEWVVYISCNPVTLARDLRYLGKTWIPGAESDAGGYVPVDSPGACGDGGAAFQVVA